MVQLCRGCKDKGGGRPCCIHTSRAAVSLLLQFSSNLVNGKTKATSAPFVLVVVPLSMVAVHWTLALDATRHGLS